jgi:hypothetical protein
LGSGQSEEVTADEIVAEMERWIEEHVPLRDDFQCWRLMDYIKEWLKGKR